jgi:alpha-tubulin suppressor-like RCC1 family protein
VFAEHSLAVRTDGTVLAWGQNGSGQLCLGTGTAGGVRTTATPIPNFNLGPRPRPQ